jgi:type III restriction enzyme
MGGGESERHIKLLSVKEKPSYTAELELKVINTAGDFAKKKIKVNPGNRRDLEALTKNPVYAGLFVANISTQPGREFVEFDNSDFVQLAAGTNDSSNVKAQIRATIERHLDREMQLLEQNIKVLTLFFLDKVGNYREYTEKGPELGPYAKMFEEQYLELIKLPRFNKLFDNEEVKKYMLTTDVRSAHDGYFAMDKGKKGSANAGENVFVESRGGGTAAKDESAYDLIMKDKERLLSTDTPLRFIFSHSALKEGWDNPNVFQICTLVETNDTMTKRQKVGRGLRLPVYSSGDKQGERVRDEELNILTVIANKSYTAFADSLQKEIEG